jgi:altronate hydrolase
VGSAAGQPAYLYGQKGVAAGKRHFNIRKPAARKSVEKAMLVLAEIAEEVGKRA